MKEHSFPGKLEFALLGAAGVVALHSLVENPKQAEAPVLTPTPTEIATPTTSVDLSIAVRRADKDRGVGH